MSEGGREGGREGGSGRILGGEWRREGALCGGREDGGREGVEARTASHEETARGVVDHVLTHAAGTKMRVATAVKLPGRNPKKSKSLTEHHHINIPKEKNLACFMDDLA